MNEEEMELTWKELNEKIDKSSLINKEAIAFILDSRRKSAWQKLVVADKTATLFCFLFTIALSYILFRVNNGFMWLNIQAINILITASILNCISYLKLLKMDLNGSVLTLYRQMASYKKIVAWAYLISYILVFIFILSMYFNYPLPIYIKILIPLIFPICIAIDYFIYHWSSNIISSLIDTTKELKDLKDLK